MAVQQRLRQAQLAAQQAHLVLVQLAQGLDDEAAVDHLLDFRHAVVVRLDERRVFRSAAFDGVGIDRPLHQLPVLPQIQRPQFFAQHLDEQPADDRALPLGVGHARQFAQEQGFGALDLDVPESGGGQEFQNVVRLAQAHQARVHVQGAHAVGADGLDADLQRHQGIDAAGHQQKERGVARRRAGLLDHAPPHAVRDPRRADAAHRQKILEHRAPAGRMHDLGMELQAEDVAPCRLVGRDRARIRRRRHAEPGRHLRDVVAMAHPNRLRGGQSREQARLRIAADRRGAVLPVAPMRELAAEQLRKQLVPETDSQHRPAVAFQKRTHPRHMLVRDRLRPAGQNQAGRPGRSRPEILRLRHRAIDAQPAHAVGDQVRVLPAEIEDGQMF